MKCLIIYVPNSLGEEKDGKLTTGGSWIDGVRSLCLL